jgi:hypothetical protein
LAKPAVQAPLALDGAAQKGHTLQFEAFVRADDVESM